MQNKVVASVLSVRSCTIADEGLTLTLPVIFRVKNKS